jgi:tetratricopeptide (TPR) repeat protein
MASMDECPGAMHCTICLDSEGEVVQRGCCCRGDAGAVHLACLIESAIHSSESRGDWSGWVQCATCHSQLGGHTQFALAEAMSARVDASEAEADDHGDVNRMYAMGLLGGAHYVLGRYSEAERLQTELLAMQVERFGNDHLDTLVTRTDLSTTYFSQGRHAECIETEREILRVTQQALPADDPETITSEENLACSLDEVGRSAESFELMSHALSARKRVQGPEHVDTLNTAYNLITVHMSQRAYATAEAELVALRPTIERVCGSNHMLSIAVASKLGQTLLYQGRLREAEGILRPALTDSSVFVFHDT